MKVFIWENIEEVSGRYHSNGGLVVIADNEVRAREIANIVPGCYVHPEETPNYIRDVSDGEEKVFIFPDAGCC